MWKKYTIEPNKIYYWKLGACEFWVKKQNKEWQIASKNFNEPLMETSIAKEVDEPNDVEWKSFIADKSNLLNIVPALPDRPVVVKPNNTFKLLPNMNVQLYVHIPVWIQLYSGSAKKENLVYEFSSYELSSTWFGYPDNGILSYSLTNSIDTSFDKSSLANFKTVCPIKITNDCQTALDFQRLSLLVEFLNIYSENNLLFTSETKVKFKGENVVSEINYGQSAPSFIENPKHLASPRNPEKNNVLKKSFHFIKSLTDY